MRACGRDVDTCDINANRDLTRNTFLALKTYHVIQPSGSRTSLRDRCLFCLVHILWSLVTRSALVPLESVRFLRQCWLPCHCVNTNSCHPVCTRFPHSPAVLLTRVPCSVSVEPTSTTLSTLSWRSYFDHSGSGASPVGGRAQRSLRR